MVQAKFFARRIQKSHLKCLKINCFWVIVHVCLNLGAGRPSLKKVCGIIEKWKFYFSMCSTVWTFSLPKMKFCSFTISSQFNFKKRAFFSNLQTGKMEILTTTSNWLLKWSSWLAALKKFIHLKVLDKQASWTYVRLIFELFLVISWLWFALDHLRCWEDRC